MMATVPHVTSGLGLRKFHVDGFLLTRVYVRLLSLSSSPKVYTIKCELRQIIFVFAYFNSALSQMYLSITVLELTILL